MKKPLSEEDKNTIVYLYRDLEKSRNQIEKELNISDYLIKKILLERGIPIRKQHGKALYSMNHNYFKNQGHNQFYIIGFLAADGNLSSKDNRIDLELCREDYEILEKIRNELELERPIKKYQCSSGYEKNKLYFYSKEIKSDLMKYGLVPNKTYSKDFSYPYLMKNIFFFDYLRGYFDGNGCVKKTGKSLTFQIDCPNQEILLEIQKKLLELINVDTKIVQMKMKNIFIYRLCCYGDKAKKIFNNLYTPNSLFLERKARKLKEILNDK